MFVGCVCAGGGSDNLSHSSQVFRPNEILPGDVLGEPPPGASSTLEAPVGDKILKVSLSLIV